MTRGHIMTMQILTSNQSFSRYVGWVVHDHGSQSIRCHVEDVCRSGAKLRWFVRHCLPDEFTLHFTRTGAARMRCKVKWRSERAAGIEFLAATSDDRVSLGHGARMIDCPL
jgi:hypothetical protein